MARQAARLNSLSDIALTKLDVLDALETVKVCVAYEADGRTYEYPPYHQSVLHSVVPIFEELEGWREDLTACTSFDDLPRAAQRYVAFLAERIDVPIHVVGVGPGREQFVAVP
jgi:adenylosuccinate synthase